MPLALCTMQTKGRQTACQLQVPSRWCQKLMHYTAGTIGSSVRRARAMMASSAASCSAGRPACGPAVVPSAQAQPGAPLSSARARCRCTARSCRRRSLHAQGLNVRVCRQRPRLRLRQVRQPAPCSLLPYHGTALHADMSLFMQLPAAPCPPVSQDASPSMHGGGGGSSQGAHARIRPLRREQVLGAIYC